jgi:hypothetical protein
MLANVAVQKTAAASHTAIAQLPVVRKSGVCKPVNAELLQISVDKILEADFQAQFLALYA